jgi:hypothetical protein
MTVFYIANAPQVSVPQSVTMRQARLALHAHGLLASVQSAIDSLPEPHRSEAQIEWDYSNGLERQNPFVATLGAALGLDNAALDALFVEASRL